MACQTFKTVKLTALGVLVLRRAITNNVGGFVTTHHGLSPGGRTHMNPGETDAQQVQLHPRSKRAQRERKRTKRPREKNKTHNNPRIVTMFSSQINIKIRMN
ncbi:hypothetical protein AMECASPLE_038851 [Ameca splendens]|uniref:Secreted protein n=1 Tax=Ameca splendens TaxID=208324 RepID=A0ABV1AG80_9TELE